MGIDPVTMMIASTALQVGSGFMQYSQQKKADKQAAAAGDAQAAIMKNDAGVAANQEKIDADTAMRIQKMAYLKSGVTLEGSPLLTLQETVRKGDVNAANTFNSATAKADLVQQQGNIKRANLAGTVLDTASGIAGSYTSSQLLKRQLQPAGADSNGIIWNT